MSANFNLWPPYPMLYDGPKNRVTMVAGITWAQQEWVDLSTRWTGGDTVTAAYKICQQQRPKLSLQYGTIPWRDKVSSWLHRTSTLEGTNAYLYQLLYLFRIWIYLSCLGYLYLHDHPKAYKIPNLLICNSAWHCLRPKDLFSKKVAITTRTWTQNTLVILCSSLRQPA